MVWNPGKSLFGGRYIIERKLGEGGIGITYLARNIRYELRVIKTLKEEILNHPTWSPHQEKLRQDFRDEAVRLAVCRHPHIVQIEIIFDDENLPCMVMEYIEGEDLGKYLRRMGVLSESEALLYIRQIGEALKVIHAKGLLHRDIKPRNIMIRTGKLEAVLIDFGIAREFIPNVVQRHTVYRTPGFAPPEQYEWEAPRGEYIDVYALAATLYSLLTGVVPTSADDRRRKVPLEPPQYFNPKVSDRINQAIMRGMELQPNYRPQSVQEWLDLLGSDESQGLIIPPTEVMLDDNPAPAYTPAPTPTPIPRQNPPRAIATPSQAPTPQQVLPERWYCVNTLKGHGSMVHAIAISPDGQLVASGSNDNTVKLWQIATGKLVRTLGGWFSGHSSMVNAIAFSPDGDLLATGSWDDTIKLWQVSTGKELYTLTGHSNWVNSVAFSPDGQLLVSGSADCTIKLWLVSTGAEIGTFTGHSDVVWSVAISPNGQILASGSSDNTIKLWQVRTGRELSTLASHTFFVNSVVFSQNGEILVSGSSDNTIKLWQVSTGREIRTFTGHSDTVWSVAFHPNGQLLASGSWDKTIKIWQIDTGIEISTLNGHSNYVRTIAFNPNGRTLVSGSDDQTVKIWQRG
jgi:WD40 repeat protein/tRNA A-37 threonylcarbamoyl transferase component Bud32